MAYLTNSCTEFPAEAVVERVDLISGYRRKAKQNVVRTTAESLEAARVLLVHDYSSMAAEVLVELGGQRPREVIVTAGEPLGQGAKVASIAATAGHRVTYVPDMGAARHRDRVHVFISGVETFYEDGSLANTIGTTSLALMLLDAGATVTAPAESLKLHPQLRTANNSRLSARLLHPWPQREPRSSRWEVDNHVLDAVPARLISRYVTEVGACAPSSVGAMSRGPASRWA